MLSTNPDYQVIRHFFGKGDVWEREAMHSMYLQFTPFASGTAMSLIILVRVEVRFRVGPLTYTIDIQNMTHTQFDTS